MRPNRNGLGRVNCGSFHTLLWLGHLGRCTLVWPFGTFGTIHSCMMLHCNSAAVLWTQWSPKGWFCLVWSDGKAWFGLVRHGGAEPCLVHGAWWCSTVNCIGGAVLCNLTRVPVEPPGTRISIIHPPPLSDNLFRHSLSS